MSFTRLHTALYYYRPYQFDPFLSITEFVEAKILIVLAFVLPDGIGDLLFISYISMI